MRAIVILFFCATQLGLSAQNIIPYPRSSNYKYCEIDLNKSSFIVRADEGLSQFLETFLRVDVLGDLALPKKTNTSTNIRLVSDDSFDNEEAYQLKIIKGLIEIKGQEPGIFYGLQTLRQLVFEGNGKLPCQTIIDSPSFQWRGMHLDVSRHFFPIDFIKKYIDILAMHKMNTFHWHLTDDQGWRIEIKKYPKLTEIGSKREETIIAKNFSPYKGDGIPYEGFYTQEDIKEIVAYAKERCITVVPEIEMPGHSVAALSGYPEYSCRQLPLKTLTKWGISDDVYCSKDSTFEFIFNILDEVLELFPAKFIHIGGDEAPKTRWKSCAKCQKVIADKKLKDEHELQSYFIGRIDSFLTSKGRNTIGWDEILEGGLAKNAAVMSWRGEEGGIAAAKQKHNVVMSPGSHCYFDHYQGNKKTEPLAIGGYTTIQKVYSYNPIPSSLTKDQSKYILGAQGNVWTEYMETPEHVMYMALPRLCALSEVLWTGKDKPDFEHFSTRLLNHFKLLDTLNINYGKSIYDINAKTLGTENGLEVSLLSDLKNKEIRFATDGSEPSYESSLYKTPIEIKTSTQINAALFDGKTKLGNIFSQDYRISPSTGKKYKLATEPSKSYSSNKETLLTDGIIGTLPWTGNEWLGWKGTTMETTIDMGHNKKINQVNFSFLEAKESWIWFPKKIEILTSNNGFRFETTAIINIDHLNVLNKSTLIKKELNTTTRYIKIKAIPSKHIPEGFSGAGESPWLFCSEIIIE